VDAHAKTGLGKTKRSGAARDSSTHDRDMHPAVVVTVRATRDRVIEPVRIQDIER
jgi:hypothetical protein